MCKAGDKLLFTNCSNPEGRTDLTAKLINQSGNVEETLYISKQAGYSDVCFNNETNSAFVVFEAEKDIRIAKIGF